MICFVVFRYASWSVIMHLSGTSAAHIRIGKTIMKKWVGYLKFCQSEISIIDVKAKDRESMACPCMDIHRN